MKKLILFTVLFLIVSIMHAQLPFKVITVNGEIVATKANITLENGVEIYSDDNFDFRKPNSRAAMINSERGRVVLTEQNASDAFSKAAFAPAISSVSARSGAVSSIAELKSIFDDKLLIIECIKLKVGSAEFPMEDNKFFFIRYTYNDEIINKKLSFNLDTLIIDKNELFTVDGKAIESQNINQFNLYYHQKGSEQPESILINAFEPIFVSTKQLKPEIDIIFEEFKGKSFDIILSEVYDYLNSFYGKVDRGYIEKWLKKEYKVEI
jgi:hypothetical protein